MTELIVLDKKEWDEIKRDIKEIKDVLQSQGKISVPKKWYTAKETSLHYNCAVRTIYHYCNKGLLNPKRIGGILLFSNEELEGFLKK
jgi:hypothetical protein